MKILPELEFLNSLPVDREAMEEDEVEGHESQHFDQEDHTRTNGVRVNEVI